MIDFKKKLANSKIELKINPVEIYENIDRKSITGPLRNSQREILEEWYNKRKNDKDLIIKLNTGEGKTLIGLLILQSRINSGEGPCLYVCPNKYLVSQVCEEAEKFGIPYCVLNDEFDLPDEYIDKKKLMITHAAKLFNGMTIFGVGNHYKKANTIILDDAHACIDVIKQAYTIKIDRDTNNTLYMSILNLFKDNLMDQRQGSFIDIENGETDTLMTIPYWNWQEKQTEVLTLISKNIDEPCIKFTWPLFRDKSKYYECYINGRTIEISPHIPNIDAFKTFNNANHRILMSATTQDDIFFIKGFSFSLETIKNPLTSSNKWSGEKMIIIPSIVDDRLDRNFVLTKMCDYSYNDFGVVSIVPSSKICAQYQNMNCLVTDRSNIREFIEKLKNKEINKILVVNNRYDGIDLPDESCRILIIDSLPYFDNLSDRYEEACRPNSEIIYKLLAQKIEQGLGRGVRGEKDYCVILILGKNLTNFIRQSDTNKYFSSQTRKQIEISKELSESLKSDIENSSDIFSPVKDLIFQCINRDEGWKVYYTENMNNISIDENDYESYKRYIEEFEIEKLYESGRSEDAYHKMQDLINTLKNEDNLEKGWYTQQLARYCYSFSKTRFDEVQRRAFELNKELLAPKDGIVYRKLKNTDYGRTSKIKSMLSKYDNFESLKTYVDELLNNLQFGIKADKFEKALFDIGNLLGFESQRPDKDNHVGPDVLWCTSPNRYFIFECKSEVSDERKEINKNEAGQMNGHCAWFNDEYGLEVSASKFMIIPTKYLTDQSYFTEGVRIIRRGKLKEFRDNISKFINEFARFSLSDIDEEKIEQFLKTNKLLTDNINEYSEEWCRRKK